MSRSIHFSGLAAAAIVFAGPALVVLAKSDQGPWTSLPERFIFSTPLAIFVSAAFSYAVATSLFGSSRNWKQVVTGALGSIFIPYLTSFLTWGIFFGLGEANAYFAAGVLFVLLTLPTAAFQATVLEDGRTRLLVFAAAAFAALAAVTIYAWPLDGWNSGQRTLSYPIRLFGDAPYLIAVVPYAAIAYFKARPLPLSRFGLVLACVLAPIYLFKALAEIPSSNPFRALMWPIFTITEFVSWPERIEIRKDVEARLRNGVPVQIGEQWYRFKSVHSVNLTINRSRDPHRIDRMQITVHPRDIGLEQLAAARHNEILNIGTADRWPLELGPWRVGEKYDDLFISVNLMRDIVVDAVATRAHLKRFMEEARAVAPAN